MPTTLERIVEWSKSLPDWQSDAVRRLLTQGQLTPSDKTELLGILKTQHGLGDPATPTLAPRPLQEVDVSGGAPAESSIVLKRIDAIHNVNALPDDCSMPFGHQGLTVIYGENGSGKSGYARVLKRACGARDETESIHPNVFQPPAGPATATFKLIVDENDLDVSWRDGDGESKLLANICVFDSRCARIIIDENNKVQYLPFGADVFGKLVDLLKEVRETLELECPVATPPVFPDVPPETEAGRFLASLGVNSELETIKPWLESDEAQLAALQRQVAQALLADPSRASQQLRNDAARAKKFADDLTTLHGNASTTAGDSLRGLVSRLTTARQTLAVASQESLPEEPLPGVGGDVWHTLYKAARDYSLQAYPDLAFPNTDEDSRCVLCMQPLSDDAKLRMLRFRDYVEQRARKNVETLTGQLLKSTNALATLDISLLQTYKDVLDRLREAEPELTTRIEQYVDLMQSRVEGLLAIAADAKSVKFCPVFDNPTPELIVAANSMIAKAVEVEKSAKPEELAKLQAKKAELEARKLLRNRWPEIESYVKQLGVVAKYRQCQSDTEFARITTAGKSIIKDSLTPELCRALQDELRELKATHLPLDLKPSATAGETRHKLQIGSAQPIGKLSLSDILSEGEQRVVGIAGFLAELKGTGHTYPIVFDDPVSSLDHRYREGIARRLTQEAYVRQVVVFTHDLSFLLELQAAAGAFGIDSFGEKLDGVPLSTMAIRRGNGQVGQRSDELPWDAKGVGVRLEALKTKELPPLKALHGVDLTRYNTDAAILYGQLRETWEAFIEETLFNGVVRRHRPSIQTLRLQKVSVAASDYVAIHKGMTRCSTWMIGHDKSKALDVNRPAPEEIRADITALQELVAAVKKRQSEAAKDAETALSPRTTNIG